MKEKVWKHIQQAKPPHDAGDAQNNQSCVLGDYIYLFKNSIVRLNCQNPYSGWETILAQSKESYTEQGHDRVSIFACGKSVFPFYRAVAPINSTTIGIFGFQTEMLQKQFIATYDAKHDKLERIHKKPGWLTFSAQENQFVQLSDGIVLGLGYHNDSSNIPSGLKYPPEYPPFHLLLEYRHDVKDVRVLY